VLHQLAGRAAQHLTCGEFRTYLSAQLWSALQGSNEICSHAAWKHARARRQTRAPPTLHSGQDEVKARGWIITGESNCPRGRGRAWAGGVGELLLETQFGDSVGDLGEDGVELRGVGGAGFGEFGFAAAAEAGDELEQIMGGEAGG